MGRSPVSPVKIYSANGSSIVPTGDIVATEEPLEIRLEYGPEQDRKQLRLAVTMRTPGNDTALVSGFLFTEGIIHSPDDVLNIRYCETLATDDERENVIKVYLSPAVTFDEEVLRRNFYTTSSCGVCGKSSIEAVMKLCKPVRSDLQINSSHILRAPAKMMEMQHLFAHTGGIHAAGFFDRDGEFRQLAEDVGRHNAMDKLIGQLWHSGMDEGFVLLSGRASFELIQKAAMASVPVVAAVGAPSSLAVEMADEMGITLLGFVRNNSFNCYTHNKRIQSI